MRLLWHRHARRKQQWLDQRLGKLFDGAHKYVNKRTAFVYMDYCHKTGQEVLCWEPHVPSNVQELLAGFLRRYARWLSQLDKRYINDQLAVFLNNGWCWSVPSQWQRLYGRLPYWLRRRLPY